MNFNRLTNCLRLKRFLVFGIFLVTAIGSPLNVRCDDETDELNDISEAAEKGDADAQIELATRHLNGNGVQQSYEDAAAWYRKAAAQGNATARANLGVMLMYGKGVPQDYKEALNFLLQSTEQGSGHPQFHIGLLYANGWGVDQDSEKAARWYHLSIRRGYAHVGREFAKLGIAEDSIQDDAETADALKSIQRLSSIYGDEMHRQAKARLIQKGASAVDLMRMAWKQPPPGIINSIGKGKPEFGVRLIETLCRIGTDDALELATDIYLDLSDDYKGARQAMAPAHRSRYQKLFNSAKFDAAAKMLSEQPRPKLIPRLLDETRTYWDQGYMGILKSNLNASRETGQFKRYAKKVVRYIFNNQIYAPHISHGIIEMFGADEIAYASQYLKELRSDSTRAGALKDINFFLSLPGGPKLILDMVAAGGELAIWDSSEWSSQRLAPFAARIDLMVNQTPYESSLGGKKEMINLLHRIDSAKGMMRMKEVVADTASRDKSLQQEYAQFLLKQGQRIDASDERMMDLLGYDQNAVCVLAKKGSKLATSALLKEIQMAIDGSGELVNPLKCLSDGAWKYTDSSATGVLSEVAAFRDQASSQAAKSILAQMNRSSRQGASTK